jgi:hypothetical protein
VDDGPFGAVSAAAEAGLSNQSLSFSFESFSHPADFVLRNEVARLFCRTTAVLSTCPSASLSLGATGFWFGSVELRFSEVPVFARLGVAERRLVTRAIFCRTTAELSMRSSSSSSFGVTDASLGIVVLRSFISWRCRTSSVVASTFPSATEVDEEDEARLSDRLRDRSILASSEA